MRKNNKELKENLGKRMKYYYEDAFDYKLPNRLPIIIRLDGRAFHTYTEDLEKPFDEEFMNVMDFTAMILCEEIQNVVLIYIQSDEINVLIHNYKTLSTSAWFDNRIQKITSISASIASVRFNELANIHIHKECIKNKYAYFDSRTFILPENEVCNYFINRQNDWKRNSLNMLVRNYYSHKEILNKKKNELHDLLHEKGVNWNDLSAYIKRGRCILKDIDEHWRIDENIPIFTENRNYIEDLLKIETEKK